MTPDIDRRGLTGLRELLRLARLLVGDVLVDALNIVTPFFYVVGPVGVAFWLWA